MTVFSFSFLLLLLLLLPAFYLIYLTGKGIILLLPITKSCKFLRKLVPYMYCGWVCVYVHYMPMLKPHESKNEMGTCLCMWISWTQPNKYRKQLNKWGEKITATRTINSNTVQNLFKTLNLYTHTHTRSTIKLGMETKWHRNKIDAIGPTLIHGDAVYSQVVWCVQIKEMKKT